MPDQDRARCLLTYLVLAVAVAAVGVLVRFVPAGPLAGVFSWGIIGGFLGLGLVGVLAGRTAGIPEMWSDAVSASMRFGYPAAVGALFGLATLIDATLRPGDGEVTPFPISVPVFAAGAVLLEALLRLCVLTTTLWILRRTVARQSTGSWAFWAAAVLAALYEPLPFLKDPSGQWASEWATVLVAVRLFLFNLAGAWYFRRAGFLAALSVRWAEYAVWHVVGQSLLGVR